MIWGDLLSGFFLLADDTIDSVFGHDVAERATALDGKRCHGYGKSQIAQVESGFENDGQILGVTLCFGSVFLEIEDAGAGSALGDGIGLVARDAAHAEALGVGAASATIPVDDGIDGLVVFLEELKMEGVFADKEFGDDFGDGHIAFRRKVDDVVKRGALEEGLALAFQAVARETVFGVEVEGFVGHDDL